jgi:hypothetical protein
MSQQSFFADDFKSFYTSTEIIPLKEMSLEEKYNCIARIIFLVSIITFCFTMDFNALIGGFLAILILVVIYKVKTLPPSKEKHNNNNINKEGFTNITPKSLKGILKKEFKQTEKQNPLSNVLLTEIIDNPNRRAAPPSFNIEVNRDINNRTKEMIQSMNPTIKNTNEQLFGDLGEMFEFEQSQRNFYSTANTRVENNQTAFAHWLYGDMPSSKEGNEFALEKNNQRYCLY